MLHPMLLLRSPALMCDLPSLLPRPLIACRAQAVLQQKNQKKSGGDEDDF